MPDSPQDRRARDGVRTRLAGRLVSVVILVIAGGGCETVRALTEGLDEAPRPEAAVRAVHLRDLTLEGAELAFDVEVRNPYAVALPVAGLDYTVSSGGRDFLSGAAAPGEPIPAEGSSMVTMPVRFRYADFLSVLSTVRPGSVIPYTADVRVAVDAPAIGRVDMPLTRDGELPVPAVPKVGLDGIQWTRLGLDAAEAVLRMRIENPHRFGVDLADLDYELVLAGRRVASALVAQPASFAPGDAQVIELPLTIAPTELGLAFLAVLRGDEADYELGGTTRFDSPYGRLELPFESKGQVPFTR